MRVLLQHKNNEENKGNSSKFTPLHEACIRGINSKRVVLELLQHLKEIIQLFDACNIKRRPKIYYFLINYENMNWSHNKRRRWKS